MTEVSKPYVIAANKNPQPLTWEKLVKTAAELNVEPCLLKAIYKIESISNGYQKDGKPKILFEGHIFWSQLKLYKIDPQPLVKKHPLIVYPTWNSRPRNAYKVDQYGRLEEARKIHDAGALASASWGAFQIVGSQYKELGYKSIYEFIDDVVKGYDTQLDLLKRFLIWKKLIPYMKIKNFNEIARRYNGNGYAQHGYHIKLANAYSECTLQKH
jgi:hypothetical protein